MQSEDLKCQNQLLLWQSEYHLRAPKDIHSEFCRLAWNVYSRNSDMQFGVGLLVLGSRLYN